MIYALLNGQKIIAEPKIKAQCPLCKNTVFSKCGEVNVWHWSHLKGEGCDSWHEPESEWHKNWKLLFGKDNSEVIIKKENVKHIADILTKENVVIELQNSPIAKPIIRKRELFYGKRMLWIINGQLFKNNFDFINNSDDDDDENIETDFGLVNTITGELVTQPTTDFYWSRARRSWEGTQRHVFIDFGGEDLFLVKDGMGTWAGTGKWIRKTNFIKKYAGDIPSDR